MPVFLPAKQTEFIGVLERLTILTCYTKNVDGSRHVASVALVLDLSGHRAVLPNGFLVSQLSILMADGDCGKELPSKHPSRKLRFFIKNKHWPWDLLPSVARPWHLSLT